MVPGSILTLGLGSFGSSSLLITLGYATSGTPPIPPAPTDNGWLGGPKGKRKRQAWDYTPSAEDVQRQRIALGIIEAPRAPVAPAAKKIIRAVAKQAAALNETDSQAQARLQQEMQRQQIAVQQAHADLMLRQRDEMRSRAIALELAHQQHRRRRRAVEILLLH